MFKELSKLMHKSIVHITVAVLEDGEMTVSVTPKSKEAEISPVILSGTPEEIDENFINSIQGVMQDSATFILKKEAARKSMEEKAEAKAEAAKKKTSSSSKLPAAKSAKAEETPKKEEEPAVPKNQASLFETLI